MQKTLIALGLAAALTSFQAQAADVTLYGLVDYGFSLQHRTPVQGESDTTFKMNSGMNSGSRFGMKGTEDLGNGMKVGFVLENGFSADSGAMGQDGRIFGREASLTLSGDFGQVSFGRLGPVVGGNGTYALFGAAVSPFSCGWGDVGGHLQVTALGYEFIDNTINYRTPNFGGFDVTAQYSLGTDAKNYGEGVEGKTTVERMGAIAARYRAAGLMVVAGVETINWAQPAAGDTKLDDAMSLNLAGTYDFGVMKALRLRPVLPGLPEGREDHDLLGGVRRRRLRHQPGRRRPRLRRHGQDGRRLRRLRGLPRLRPLDGHDSGDPGLHLQVESHHVHVHGRELHQGELFRQVRSGAPRCCGAHLRVHRRHGAQVLSLVS